MQNMFLMLAVGCGVLLAQALCCECIVWLLRPKAARSLVVMPLKGDCPNIEASLRWQFFCMDFHPNRLNTWLAVVDCGADESTLKTAEKMCAQQPRAIICQKADLERILDDYSVCKAVELVLY